MKIEIGIILIPVFMILQTACMSRITGNYQNDPMCPCLPKSFSTDDLVGTWVTSYSLNDKDTIIIKGDGTYKQIYNSPDANIFYESDWSDWTIEQRESGYIRLHLKGMRRAGEIETIFNRDSGGVDPEQFTAIDYCENEIVEMPDEIILIVTGTSHDKPRGIVLRQARLSGSNWTWSYELFEE